MVERPLANFDLEQAIALRWALRDILGNRLKLSPLKDDKGLFPPYFLAPVVRMDTVAGNPKAVEALQRVGALIDNPTMQELNRQVEVDKKEPRAVAAAFLKAKGVIR